MAFTAKKLIDSQQLTDSVATYYPCPVNTTAQAGELVLCNHHTAAVGVDLYLVPSGGSPTAANQLFKNGSNGLILAPNETRQIALNQVLTAGDTIRGLASVTAVVTIRLSGVEFV